MTHQYIIYVKSTGNVIGAREGLEPLEFSDLDSRLGFKEVPNAGFYCGTHKLVGDVLEVMPPPRDERTTEQKRWTEYPTMAQQITMIWQALSEIKSKPFSSDVQSMIEFMSNVDKKHPKT